MAVDPYRLPRLRRGVVSVLRVELRARAVLSGWEFERWLEAFFQRLGFEVVRTPFRGDFGADLIITSNGISTAVQLPTLIG